MLLIKYGPRHVINYNISRLSNALNIHIFPLFDINNNKNEVFDTHSQIDKRKEA